MPRDPSRTEPREHELGQASREEAGAAVLLRTKLGRTAISMRALGTATVLLDGAGKRAPRYKPTAVALIRLGFARGRDHEALLAASRYFAAALDPAPLRYACDRLFKAGARIRDVTPILADIAGEVHIQNPMRDRVKRAARPADERDWDRRVNYGSLSSQMSFARLRLMPSDKQLAAILEPGDYTPVREAVEAGHPVVLPLAHIGPELFCVRALMADGFPLAVISALRQLPNMPHVKLIPVQDNRGTVLARVVRMLRRGTAVCSAPDERLGGEFVPFEFLGAPVRVAEGTATLARLTGAKSFFTYACWLPDGRVSTQVRELQVPDHDDDAVWCEAWNRAYMREVERAVVESPELIRLFAGIWRRDNWTAEEMARQRAAVGG